MRLQLGGRVLLVALLAAVFAALTVGTAAAKPRGFNGKIVTNSDNLVTGEEQVYTVAPDGTDEQLVYQQQRGGPVVARRLRGSRSSPSLVPQVLFVQR